MSLKGLKKAVLAWLSLLFLLFCSGCSSAQLLDLPFSASQIEQIEVYRFVVPAQAEKKTVTDADEIQEIYDILAGVKGKDNNLDPEAGAQVTSFRFRLTGGTVFEMAYVAHSEKLGEVKSEKFDYQTPADLSCIWDDYGGESAVPALESELPVV